MTLIFTTIGSAADYGTFGRWLLFIITVICWAAQFASMSLTCEHLSGLSPVIRNAHSLAHPKLRTGGALRWPFT